MLAAAPSTVNTKKNAKARSKAATMSTRSLAPTNATAAATPIAPARLRSHIEGGVHGAEGVVGDRIEGKAIQRR